MKSKLVARIFVCLTVTSFTSELWSVVNREALLRLRCNLDDEY